jgi:hypothetical protein
MIKHLSLIGLACWVAVHAHAQMTMTVNYPNTGILTRNQVWNFSILNAGVSQQARVNMVVSDIQTGNVLLLATTSVVDVHAGSNSFSHTMFSTIDYTPLSTSFNRFLLENALFPVGNYIICFNLTALVGDGNLLVENCESVDIESMVAFELLLPENGAKEAVNRPYFNWQNAGFGSLDNQMTRYEFSLVELQPNEQADQAILTNAKLVQEFSLNRNSFQYPSQLPALMAGKTYAWRVIAKHDLSIIAISETWTFSINDSALATDPVDMSPFVRLSQTDAHTIMNEQLFKLEYFNELADTSVGVKIYDLSGGRNAMVWSDHLKLSAGQNMISYAIKDSDLAFDDRKNYLLVLENSRGEKWKLRFEYKR